MTYVIAEPCVNVLDQSCVAVCPVDCIHFEEGVDRMLYIDPDERPVRDHRQRSGHRRARRPDRHRRDPARPDGRPAPDPLWESAHRAPRRRRLSQPRRAQPAPAAVRRSSCRSPSRAPRAPASPMRPVLATRRRSPPGGSGWARPRPSRSTGCAAGAGSGRSRSVRARPQPDAGVQPPGGGRAGGLRASAGRARRPAPRPRRPHSRVTASGVVPTARASSATRISIGPARAFMAVGSIASQPPGAISMEAARIPGGDRVQGEALSDPNLRSHRVAEERPDDLVVLVGMRPERGVAGVAEGVDGGSGVRRSKLRAGC